jgi:hypothetical protein
VYETYFTKEANQMFQGHSGYLVETRRLEDLDITDQAGRTEVELEES